MSEIEDGPEQPETRPMTRPDETEPSPNERTSRDRPPLREITDARTLRALSHPVRLALMEEMTIAGVPMTATELGEAIGESPTTCSFHLRQLAKYGFVEEAGGGKGRARPWRVTSIGMSFGLSQNADPEYEIASSTLAQMYRERSFARYRAWMDNQASYPRKWRAAASSSEYVFYLTAEELEAFNHELDALYLSRMNHYLDRLTDPSLRPPGSTPVEMLVMSWPVHFPEGESADDEPAVGDQPEAGAADRDPAGGPQ